MLRVTRDKYTTSLSEKNEPVAYASSGETVLFETKDCFSNSIKNENQFFSKIGWCDVNPATGPLYIKEAKVGNILKVDIIDISLGKKGVTVLSPGDGAYGNRWTEEKTKIIDVEDGQVYFNDKITLKTKPMIGVIGTAPANGESIPTGTPGAHGGNMDCKRICAGTTLYLPVNVDGALLSMGDLHAVMGDGEVSVCGIEIPGEVTVKVEVIKDTRLPLPFLVDDNYAMTIYSAETLDEAAQGAADNMLDFLKDNVGMCEKEGAMLLSAIADLRICQVVDPLKTCRMELPLDILVQNSYKLP